MPSAKFPRAYFASPVAYVFNEARPNGWVMASVAGDAMEFELRALNPNHEQHRQKISIPLAAAAAS